MRQAGERTNDLSVLARVMSCPAAHTKLESVRVMLEGRRIRKVEFENAGEAVAIRLHLDYRQQVVVAMAELSLVMLLRDPEIARQEQDLYYRNHVYRPIGRRRRKKGTNTNDAET